MITIIIIYINSGFYEPYNTLLSSILSDEKFKWTQQPGDMSLRERQLQEAASIKTEPNRNNENLSAGIHLHPFHKIIIIKFSISNIQNKEKWKQ
jgi:hypothetical protein